MPHGANHNSCFERELLVVQGKVVVFKPPRHVGTWDIESRRLRGEPVAARDSLATWWGAYPRSNGFSSKHPRDGGTKMRKKENVWLSAARQYCGGRTMRPMIVTERAVRPLIESGREGDVFCGHLA